MFSTVVWQIISPPHMFAIIVVVTIIILQPLFFGFVFMFCFHPHSGMNLHVLIHLWFPVNILSFFCSLPIAHLFVICYPPGVILQWGRTQKSKLKEAVGQSIVMRISLTIFALDLRRVSKMVKRAWNFPIPHLCLEMHVSLKSVLPDIYFSYDHSWLAPAGT